MNPTQLKIEIGIWSQLFDHARTVCPQECSGLLWTGLGGVVDRFSAYPGSLYSDRFVIDDRWLLETCYQHYRDGFRFAGVYHSHPRGGVLVPSRRDVVGHPLGTVGVILDPQAAVARAFRYLGPQQDPKEVLLQIVETL